jgi:hypothetical protein
MNAGADEYVSRGSRWRWVALGMLPGLLSIVMFAGWYLSNSSRSDVLVSLGTGLLFGGGLLPFVAPFYLVELGRRYVRVVHGGYQSVTPFVLMYSAANFALWLGGGLGVLSAIGYR